MEGSRNKESGLTLKCLKILVLFLIVHANLSPFSLNKIFYFINVILLRHVIFIKIKKKIKYA